MIDIQIDALNRAVEELKVLLKDGLQSTDIWDANTGLSLAAINPQPAAVALFTSLTQGIKDTLSGAGFPGLGRSFMLELEGGYTVILLQHHQELVQGIMVDNKKVNLGMLLSVAVPKMLSTVAAAIR